MLRVLIIDKNDHRREALTAKLSEHGMLVSSMSMISLESYENTLLYADVIVLLDQAIELVDSLLSTYRNDKSKLLLSNAEIAWDKYQSDTVIYLNKTGIEAAVFNRLTLYLRQIADPRSNPIAEDPSSRATLEIAKKAAKSNATILINGETGVGKEVLAHYIHYHSLFQHGPFVSVNCAALPESMIEAILFGYEKGAFTSAVNQYVGKFEQAQNGTLLLDEVSEISIALQAKLLRVLQEREIERLGGKKTISINIRIIAATNRDLNQQVALGAFRKDLYYRLNVIPITCSPLRERTLDIVPMANYLLEHHAKLLNRSIPKLTEASKRKLLEYQWPGNIREMDNVIQRALIMIDGDVIDEEDFYLTETLEAKHPENVIVELEPFSSKLKANEAKVIMDVLREANGCRNIAAKQLNMSPRTLRYKIAKLRSIGLKVL